MNITILGQGAIGLLWYHQLAKDASNHVSLMCSARVESAPLITTFTDINNQTTNRALILTTNDTLPNAELILLCVKSYHVATALLPIAKQINANATVIFCHNGMIDFKQFASLTQPCYALLTTHGSKRVKPFHAQHTGLGHNDLGLLSGDQAEIVQKKIVYTLSKALPSLTLSDNIKMKQWLKLAINCVINPITAIDNIENGQLLSNTYDTVIETLLNEIVAVARYKGIILSSSELKMQALTVANNTRKNCSSMRSDILQHRKTEIDYINGYIINIAKEAGIPVPENERLLQQVKDLEI